MTSKLFYQWIIFPTNKSSLQAENLKGLYLGFINSGLQNGFSHKLVEMLKVYEIHKSVWWYNQNTAMTMFNSTVFIITVNPKL